MDAIDTLRKFIGLDIERVSSRHLGFVDPMDAIIQRNKRMNPTLPQLHQNLSVYERIPLEEARALEFLQLVARWLPANPSKARVVNDVNSTYLPRTPSSAEKPDYKIANVLNEDGTFPFNQVTDTASYVFLNGVRGVGKTAFMNYWLNNNTRDFEQQGKIWFRIDATKVHDIWEANPRDRNVEDLFDRYYLYHSLYVIFRYGGAFALNRRDMTGKLKATSDIFKRFVSELAEKVPDHFQAVNDAFLHAEEMEPLSPDRSVEIVQRAIESRTKEKDHSFRSCKQELSRIFERDGLKCIAIIDGIDNIAWTKNNKFYQRTCLKFTVITRRVMRCFGHKCCLIFASRPETLYEIMHSTARKPGESPGRHEFGDRSLDFQEWHVLPPSASDILLRKIEAAKDTSNFVDQRLEFATYDADVVELNKILDEISVEVRQYPDAMVSNIKHGLEAARKANPSPFINEVYDNLDKDNLLTYLFDNDVRAYLDNVLRVFFLRRSLLRNRNLPQAEFQRRLMQFTFMNGELWFRSREQYRRSGEDISRAHYVDRGLVFPNIFWWPTEKTGQHPSRWFGLAGLRLLQLAKLKRSFCVADLLHSIRVLFDYPEALLSEIVEAFVAYGFLDIQNAVEQTFFSKNEFGKSSLQDYKVSGYLTAKGEIFQSVLFTRPDLLYFYALDTPLKLDLVQDRTTIVRTFIEPQSGSVEDDFFAAAIPTVACLLLHIASYSKKEETTIRRRKVTSQASLSSAFSYFGTKSELLDGIALPRNYVDNFLSWSAGGMTVRPYRSKQKTDQICQDIVGIFGQFTES